MSTVSGNALYDLSIGAYLHGMQTLAEFLKKSEAHADANKIPHSQLLQSRIIDDMEALAFQVQRVSDSAKGAAVRVGGLDPVPMADDETTFEQLYVRVQKTVDLLQTIKPESFEGKEKTEVSFKLSGRDITWPTTRFLQQHVTPNFYFHMAMTYALLRKQGMPLGKKDFLNNALWREA